MNGEQLRWKQNNKSSTTLYINNITKLNELIYAGEKLVCEKIGIPLKNTKDKYLNLARELKKLWNMKVTILPIVIAAFGTVTKGLLKKLEDFEIEG